MAVGAVYADVGTCQRKPSRRVVETRLLETDVERMTRRTFVAEEPLVSVLVAGDALGILQQVRSCRPFGYGSGR
jgi:hypothetical protein